MSRAGAPKGADELADLRVVPRHRRFEIVAEFSLRQAERQAFRNRSTTWLNGAGAPRR